VRQRQPLDSAAVDHELELGAVLRVRPQLRRGIVCTRDGAQNAQRGVAQGDDDIRRCSCQLAQEPDTMVTHAFLHDGALRRMRGEVWHLQPLQLREGHVGICDAPGALFADKIRVDAVGDARFVAARPERYKHVLVDPSSGEAVQGADAGNLAPFPIAELYGLLPALDVLVLILADPERLRLVVDRHRPDGLALGRPPPDVERTRVGTENEDARFC